MKTSNELKQLRASKFDAQKSILATAKGEKRSELNEDETQRFDDLQAELDDLDKQIVRAEKFSKTSIYGCICRSKCR